MIEIDEVFVARMACGGQASSMPLNSLSLSSMFSVAASIAMSQSLNAATESTGVSSASTSSRRLASILPFSTPLPRILAIDALPFSAISRLMSAISTLQPASAATCAMPAPIWPVPSTPTVLNSIDVLPFRTTAPP